MVEDAMHVGDIEIPHHSEPAEAGNLLAGLDDETSAQLHRQRTVARYVDIRDTELCRASEEADAVAENIRFERTDQLSSTQPLGVVLLRAHRCRRLRQRSGG